MSKGLEYYEVLGLTRNADDLEIRRAYRRLALKFHPDTNSEPDAKEEFSRICESYDVLSDPKRKGFHDLFGEHALKDGASDGQEGVRGGFYQFNPEITPTQVFERFFGTSNVYQALEGMSAEFEAMTTMERPKVGKNKVYAVELTLEEIFHGCLKKLQHRRKVLHADGEYSEEIRTLTIDVKPGLPTGTRFVFEGEGNRTPRKEPGPVVFVLKPLPHARFVRRGVDLLYKVTLPLYQALTGAAVEVKMLDDRTLTVPVADIITPGSTITVPGEGMPKTTGGKGSLILDIQLLFPSSITEMQKMLLKAAFFLPPHASSREVPDRDAPKADADEDEKPARMVTVGAVQHKALRVFEASFLDPETGWGSVLPKQERC
ncbi:MAG: hypothetical protein WDW36_002481 [Sanguina aurantia]